MIKYSYALSDSNEIIHVEKIEKAQRHNHKYYCLGCGAELIPRLGEKRQKHFAHKIEVDSASCSSESYLHNTAKNLLFKAIKQKISTKQPLYLFYPVDMHCSFCHFPGEGNVDCYLDTIKEKYNLLTHFHEVRLEKRIDNFIPDLVLSRRNGDRIFIEIAVTHYSESEKVNSGNKIVEITIDSEDDIQYLGGDMINPTQLNTKLIGFRFKEKTVRISRDECRYGSKNAFIIFRTGKACLFANLTNSKFFNLKKSQWLYFTELKDFNGYAQAFINSLEAAYLAGINVQNCYLCRYHGYQSSSGKCKTKVFCKFLRIKISKSNYAIECKYFHADANSFHVNQK